MKKLFEISSEEKQRILEMHVSATKKNYLSEQETEPVKQGQPAAGPTINGVTYKLQGLTDKNINNFLNVTSNYGLCHFFDPTLYKIQTDTAGDKKRMVGDIGFCQVSDPGNPCCDMVSNLKDYINVLGKSFTTLEEIKNYPFSKYTSTAQKGKSFKSTWTIKMKDYLTKIGAGDLYDEAIAEPLLGTKGAGSESFDILVFRNLVNGQLENAGLPTMSV